jgi:glycosyltransferase involved in cell wall biosynthesis
MTVPSLSLVLPAFNEASNLPEGLAEAREVFSRAGAGRLDWEVVVVDDGSADETAAVVRALAELEPRIRLVQHAQNRGYGAALRSGFEAATKSWVMFTDADLQFDLAEVDRLLAHTARFEIISGYRAPRRDPWNRRANAWAWGRLVNTVFDLGVRDVNCAFKLFRRDVLEGVRIRSSGAFVNTEILARARAAGFRIKEVPVSHFPRRHGVQTGAHPKVVLRAFGELARLYGELSALRAPARVETWARELRMGLAAR